MDVLANLATGLSVSLSLGNLAYCFFGVLIGTLIGVLPGVGPLAAVAILLPFTLGLPADSSLIMLAGIYYGAQYGGSTTAILLNMPGESSSAVTTIDGYQMAKQGRAGPALAAAALSSFFAGCVATLVIALFAKPFTTVALSFRAPEYFSLIVVGLVASVSLASGSVVKALGMMVFGLLLGLIGTDIYTGTARFNFGFMELADGIEFVTIAVGIFGIAEIMRNLETNAEGEARIAPIGRIMPRFDDLKRIIGPSMRGTAVGSLLGILPGGGALLSSFAAYTLEKKVSPNKKMFGQGAIEGVAAPESANNAGAQTSFIPLLTLGVPSNAIMALMVGAMMIQGLVPGPTVATRNPELFWGIITSMWVGNLMLVLLNLPLVGMWVRLLKVPYGILIPAIIAFSAIGVYSLQTSSFELIVVSIFGLLGYFLQRWGCEPAPLAIGFVLGPMLEEYFRRAMLISRGDASVFVTQPISASLLACAFVLLAITALPAFANARKKVFVED